MKTEILHTENRLIYHLLEFGCGVQMMKDVMGPFQDIPGPEISTGSKVVFAITHYYQLTNQFKHASILK